MSLSLKSDPVVLRMGTSLWLQPAYSNQAPAGNLRYASFGCFCFVQHHMPGVLFAARHLCILYTWRTYLAALWTQQVQSLCVQACKLGTTATTAPLGSHPSDPVTASVCQEPPLHSTVLSEHSTTQSTALRSTAPCSTAQHSL